MESHTCFFEKSSLVKSTNAYVKEMSSLLFDKVLSNI